ncbi:DUF2059 domain-containing protein [Roseibium limicola]|uniref:DUF2059 domain-containing protein n=1 Tax=Roseibium limicola TaxID=2816037 RepID=A0A939J5R4_9HYPH|nr:DUF2059 domain-containing protein [Roseibium limicola]MBO0346100.1 DUF2059 domain-containing protein [Roseibium limicola]
MKLTSIVSYGVLFAATLVLATAQPLRAQENEFSESHIEAARKVVVATKAMGSFDDILPVLAEQTRTLFVQADPSRTQEIVDVTSEMALKLAPRRRDLNNTIYQVWARRFSEEELNQLTAFYESPLGSKVADSGPTITALAIGAAREWQNKMSTELVAMVREELDKRAAEAQ